MQLLIVVRNGIKCNIDLLLIINLTLGIFALKLIVFCIIKFCMNNLGLLNWCQMNCGKLTMLDLIQKGYN